MEANCRFPALRSSQGFSVAMTVVVLEFVVWLVMSSPPNVVQSATPGVDIRIASTASVTRRLRSSDAPSGRRTATKKTPWSSSGRKPEGRTRNRPPAAAKKKASAAIARTDLRTSSFTPER